MLSGFLSFVQGFRTFLACPVKDRLPDSSAIGSAAPDRRTTMAHRQLLTDEEGRALLGIPLDADSMARCFTLSRADQELVAARRQDSNRIGFAVQLASFATLELPWRTSSSRSNLFSIGWPGSSRFRRRRSSDMHDARRR